MKFGIVLALLLAACGDDVTSSPDATPAPCCAVACPHEKVCDGDVGWTCGHDGDTCVDPKPCGPEPVDNSCPF